jgi:hypothetical protein
VIVTAENGEAGVSALCASLAAHIARLEADASAWAVLVTDLASGSESVVGFHQDPMTAIVEAENVVEALNRSARDEPEGSIWRRGFGVRLVPCWFAPPIIVGR